MPFFKSDDDLDLFYTDEGDGLPVIALAGLTRNVADFEYVAPHLPVRLIRMDYRGRGRSEWGDHLSYTIPQEARDAVALMDHLGIEKAAILGTSRGGLIGMVLAASAKDRLLGIALNDIGPEIADAGMDAIKGYLGVKPPQKSLQEAAAFRAKHWRRFEDVPMERWLTEVTHHYRETSDGLELRYDQMLREAVLNTDGPLPDLWPLFDQLDGLPTALVRGANSDLLTKACADEMAKRRPDMIRVDVDGRGHVPFLDEPQALDALHRWLELMT